MLRRSIFSQPRTSYDHPHTLLRTLAADRVHFALAGTTERIEAYAIFLGAQMPRQLRLEFDTAPIACLIAKHRMLRPRVQPSKTVHTPTAFGRLTTPINRCTIKQQRTIADVPLAFPYVSTVSSSPPASVLV